MLFVAGAFNTSASNLERYQDDILINIGLQSLEFQFYSWETIFTLNHFCSLRSSCETINYNVSVQWTVEWVFRYIEIESQGTIRNRGQREDVMRYFAWQTSEIDYQSICIGIYGKHVCVAMEIVT